jgi:mannose-1-phosphate guanylyltransferase / mannose-6-phosphate isomerase
MHLVVLCGGAGTRLWPLSRAAEPKQFLALPKDASLIEQTLERAGAYGITAPPFVVCGRDLAPLLQGHLRRCGAEARIVLEPERRNTAPAIAAVAQLLVAEDPQALMLVTPADHFIADAAPLGVALREARALAERGAIVTFGITPRAANPNYGYIEQGEAVSPTARRVKRFVEKPPPNVAEEFVRSRRFSWNSGIFLFRADKFLAELRSFEPGMASAVAASVHNGRASDNGFLLDPESFRAAPDRSIDYAVMERTADAVVVPLDLEWSDLGSWQALWEIMDKDSAGNVRHGDVLAIDCRDTLLRSNGRLLAAVGVENLVVVDTPDAVLVAPREHAQSVKAIVDELRLRRRPEAETPAIVVRPWGSFQTICETPTYKVKRIHIYPGAAISLQYHNKRCEYWTVVQGSGLLTLGNEERQVALGDTAFIPVLAHHRLRNTGTELLEFIEVQLGEYLGEDDIVRLSDDYGRA